MAIKFDGTEVKDGWKTVGNLKRTDELKEGSLGKTIGNIKRSNEIREGSSSGGKCLCNTKDGQNIREGSSSKSNGDSSHHRFRPQSLIGYSRKECFSSLVVFWKR